MILIGLLLVLLVSPALAAEEPGSLVLLDETGLENEALLPRVEVSGGLVYLLHSFTKKTKTGEDAIDFYLKVSFRDSGWTELDHTSIYSKALYEDRRLLIGVAKEGLKYVLLSVGDLTTKQAKDRDEAMKRQAAVNAERQRQSAAAAAAAKAQAEAAKAEAVKPKEAYVSGSGRVVVIWQNEYAYKAGEALIRDGQPDLARKYAACVVDSGTRVTIIPGGYETHRIVIKEGKSRGCEGNSRDVHLRNK